jgi:hypothetical protein
MMRLNLSTPISAQPNRLGVLGGDMQGYPNGRRLTDDVVDISLQAVEGAAVTGKLVDALAAGDKVDTNDNDFGTTFPYVALPNVGPAATNGQATPPPSTTDPSAAISASPAAFQSGNDGTGTMTALGVTGATVLGGVAFGWWWMRRRRMSTVVSSSPDPDSFES